MRLLELPDASRVIGRGRTEPLPPDRPDLGLYLGRGRRDEPVPDWPVTWVPWRDFGLPTDREEAAAQIVAHAERARAGALLEVTCRGGIGRTGTVLACLLTRTGLDAPAATAWLRQHYHPHAVETAAQRRWVAWFASTHAT